jgi:hypothetical protein
MAQDHSPAPRLAFGLAAQEKSRPIDNSASLGLRGVFPSRMLLLHGMDDTTVPFTSTADCARQLRSAGLVSNHDNLTDSSLDEVYLTGVGHQDTIVQVMMGHGPTSDIVKQWMTDMVVLPSLVRYESLDIDSGVNRNERCSVFPPSTATLLVPSRL